MRVYNQHNRYGHTHNCDECKRVFYLCSERDCDLAPAVCRGCEMDRQDAYMNSLEPKTNTNPKEQTHEKQ